MASANQTLENALQKINSEVHLHLHGKYAPGGTVGYNAVFIAADAGVYFYAKLLINEKFEFLPYNRINNVSHTKSLIRSKLTITASSEDIEMLNIKHQDAADFANFVNDMLSAPAKPEPNEPPNDIFTQIEKLSKLKNAGAITDAEFEPKKSELLSRI